MSGSKADPAGHMGEDSALSGGMSSSKADPAGDMAKDNALSGDMRALLEWLFSTNRVSA